MTLAYARGLRTTASAATQGYLVNFQEPKRVSQRCQQISYINVCPSPNGSALTRLAAIKQPNAAF